MVHAWNDNDPRGVTMDRTDEGMAYALEEGMESGVWDMWLLEQNLWHREDVCDLGYLKKAWQDYWRGPNGLHGHALPEQYPGGYIHGIFGGTEFKLNGMYFLLVDYLLGFKISCDKFASVLNDILAERGCCYRFACSTGLSNPNLISPGAPIHWVFRDP
jgi:hypothetical protein